MGIATPRGLALFSETQIRAKKNRKLGRALVTSEKERKEQFSRHFLEKCENGLVGTVQIEENDTLE